LDFLYSALEDLDAFGVGAVLLMRVFAVLIHVDEIRIEGLIGNPRATLPSTVERRRSRSFATPI
jgi:hypothetical protein